MKRIMLCGLAASIVALSTLAEPALAQRRGGTPGGQVQPMPPAIPSPPRSGDLDQQRDQDRLRDRDQVPDQDRDRDQLRDRDVLQDQDRDGDGIRDQDQLRDRDMVQDRDRLDTSRAVEGQVSSWQLLSSQERLQFHQQMRSTTSEQDRERIRAAHQETIRQRARDLGIDAPFGPQRAGNGARDGYYMAQMLTEQERLQFHQRMRTAASEQERERIRTEMQTMARERARDMGVDVPAWYGAGSGRP